MKLKVLIWFVVFSLLAVVIYRSSEASGIRHKIPFLFKEEAIVVENSLVEYQEVYDLVHSYGLPFRVVNNTIIVERDVKKVDIYFGYKQLPKGSTVSDNVFIYRPED